MEPTDLMIGCWWGVCNYVCLCM